MNEKMFALFIAIFNTTLGLENMKKNDNQYEHQQEIENKIDLILKKIENIEWGLEND